ncbi:Nucleotide-diphospho-sugar transferase [Glarea lozoyensis ATCC 20868]|uniref:Chitin synthase n=1 Tax=Glarea lozoyensis (strain ATCC 20868 / MF5171) TaxID=1116229 RepID=S3CQ26_GLAL2|nr:Nucleotide-diphospho-sugar transferase [Glarea lozoyensis ATCC 20868]EPE28597.1 Nucleotide-diphospho-sugar transferase [Glarea lozoyensis ATCC 20868]
MSYNRLDRPGFGHHEDSYDMANTRPNRTPSPGDPRMHGYQLEDPSPYGGASNAPAPGAHNLEIPMGPGRYGTPSDRLQVQPTYSVENIGNSYGHNEEYDQSHPLDQSHNYQQDYAINPQQHHDAYYQPPYQPSPDEHPMQPFPGQQHEAGYYDHDDDHRPILQSDTSYGPDPHTLENEYKDYDGPAADPPLTPTPGPGLRRWKTVKEVQLFNGNLVLDCPIPPKLLNMVPHAEPPERDEFTHMRYSAATCDPSEFFEERFTLRQRLFAKPRHTELFIVVTMYNEDDVLFARTMSGVFKNIEYMCSRKDSKTWGKDAWKKIVVCVVSDGRAKINPRTRAVLAGLGVYQDGIAKQKVNGKDVTAHIYEYTTQVGIAVKKEVVELRPKQQPVQILFCLKEKNQKKINSHRWFFQAFGRVLDPNICVLIDAGTKPGKDSIYHLWKAFDLEPMCAGACGEIKAMLGTGGKNLINPLVATQNFEYKMSNILDKPLESAFGFISVLPGAFSAYRYVALQNDKAGNGPLEKYFAGEKMHGANAGIFTANMYLAEDRILCFELVSKRNCHWILQYVKSATGETDVPDQMAELILQRRRWLNGSFFAAVYALAHFYEIFRSDHSFMRKIMFLVEFIFQTINMIFAWFQLGNFFLVFHILTTSLGGDNLLGTVGKVLGVVFEWLYLFTLLTCFVLALGNRPQGSNRAYMAMVYFWAIIMCYLMFASVFITVRSIQEQTKTGFAVADIFKNQIFYTLIISLASTYLLWFVVSFLFFDPWHMFTSFLQYLLLTPTYINILNVYAFCNTHDITWGTKGDDKAEKLGVVSTKPGGKVDVNIPTDDGDLNTQYEAEMRKIVSKAPPEKRERGADEIQEDYYKGFRSRVVIFWLVCNFSLAAVVLNTGGLSRLGTKESDTVELDDDTTSNIYMAVVLWSVAGLSLFKFIGAMWFLIVRMFRGV